MTRAFHTNDRGFALVAALFLLIVIALLGIYAVRVNSSQEGATTLALSSAGAEAAVQSGIQYATARVIANGCGGLSPLNNLPQNFFVSFQCENLTETLASVPPVPVFLVTATASRGAYGTPDFVSRKRQVRIVP